MKILVIGLGSMGKRRIRLLKQNWPQIIISGVDTSPTRRKEAADLYKIATFDCIEGAISNDKFDAALICTAPLSHFSIIMECLQYDLHIFTELNVVSDGYEEMITKAAEKNKVLFLSSTMLYRNDVKYIFEEVNKNTGAVNYIYHVGQYLPDWHPWESFTNFFVNEKRTNACREIFAIEMPWLIKTFGDVKDFSLSKSKSSSLNVNYPDNYIVNFEHAKGNRGVFCVDIISRAAVRRLEVFSETLHLFWDGNPDALFKYNLELKEKEKIETYSNIDKDNRYSSNIIENAYLEELKEFFDVVAGKAEKRYSFESDKAVLAIIDHIEGEQP